MPRIEQCANADCIRYDRHADILCSECQKAARILDGETQRNWRSDGWTRYSNNRDAKPGHENGKKDK